MEMNQNCIHSIENSQNTQEAPIRQNNMDHRFQQDGSSPYINRITIDFYSKEYLRRVLSSYFFGLKLGSSLHICNQHVSHLSHIFNYLVYHVHKQYAICN